MKLREIAKSANVSLTTVSLVLNGKSGVGQEKRTQIERLLLENGYSIRSSREPDSSYKNICFLKYSKHSYLVNGNPGFVTQIMDSVEKQCRRNHYNLLITAFTDFRDINIPELLNKPSTKGAILLGTEIEDAGMAAFDGITKPLVVVDNQVSLLPYSSVTMNNRDAIFGVVRYLLSLGHRRLGFLYNVIPSGNDRERRRAFEEALVYYGQPFEPELVYSIFPTMDGACDTVRELLQRGARFPSAIVANNDSIAIGAMKAFREAGLRIPQDISLVGFDGLPFSAVSEPPLTTVSVPCAEIGAWAVRLLNDSICGGTTTRFKLLVGTELVVRGSAGKCLSQGENPHLL